MTDLTALADTGSSLIFGGALLAARLGTAVASLPGFETGSVPVRVRAMAVIVLVVVLSLGLGGVAIPPPDQPLALAVMVLREALIGAALGFALRLFIAIFEVAGSLAGISMGLSLNLFIDPTSGDQSLALGTLFRTAALLAFVAFDGHRVMLLTLFEHLQMWPVGVPVMLIPDPTALAAAAGTMAFTALQLAAPVVVMTLVLNISLAFVTRIVPSANLFGIGLSMLLIGGVLAMGLQGDAVVHATESALQSLPRQMVDIAGQPRP